jgi:transposase-like protein
MKKCSEKFATGDSGIGVGEVGVVFREHVRDCVREIIIGVMAEEVELLCGPRHQSGSSREYFRSGSASGYVLHEGRRVDVKRPRVRRRSGHGGTSEAVLSSYAVAQEPSELQSNLLLALKAGVSGREQSSLRAGNAPGVSKSEVSRLFAKEGARLLGEFRTRDIKRDNWLILMVDGVALDRDLVAVVALGVDTDGAKVLLDFEFGATENSETAKNLLSRLCRRGFCPAPGYDLLVGIDGSQALLTAVLSFFPDSAIQRCLVHKERNIRSYLPRSKQGELSSHFDRLRKAEGEEAGREALGELETFLSGCNAAALASLREAGDDLIRLHILNVPSTLNVSLLSTNLIENPFRNVRRKLGRVSRWRKETEQPSRWLAMALLEAEKGFHRLRNHKEPAKLQEALRRPRE